MRAEHRAVAGGTAQSQLPGGHEERKFHCGRSGRRSDGLVQMMDYRLPGSLSVCPSASKHGAGSEAIHRTAPTSMARPADGLAVAGGRPRGARTFSVSHTSSMRSWPRALFKMMARLAFCLSSALVFERLTVAPTVRGRYISSALAMVGSCSPLAGQYTQ